MLDRPGVVWRKTRRSQKIGVLKMTDEGGGDEKIVAVPIPKLTQSFRPYSAKVHLSAQN
jgi:inorganic pyrophosphatase